MEDETYEISTKEEHLQDKYDLLRIPLDKILEKMRLDNDDDLNKGLLYGQLVGYKPIGKDCEENWKTIRYLVNMNPGDQSSLAIIYGVAVEHFDYKSKENIQKMKSDQFRKKIENIYPITYIVREWVAGHGFSNGEDLFEKDIHDRLVLLYRLITQIEHIHKEKIPYIFLRPNKIIVTIDMDIKLMDFIRVDEYVLKKIKKDIDRKNNKVNNQHRFLYPEIFKEDFKLYENENEILIGDRCEDNKHQKDGKIKLEDEDEDIEENEKNEIKLRINKDTPENMKETILKEIEDKYNDEKYWINQKRELQNKDKELHKQNEEKKIKENYDMEFTGNEKKEQKIYHKEFYKFRKFDLWSIGCLIYYAMKEEYPWVDFINREGKLKTLKSSDEIYNYFKIEMENKPQDRMFFISKEDLPNKNKNDEKAIVFEIARRCLSGEITQVKDILYPNTNETDKEPNKTGKGLCFYNLKILKNFLLKGEVHYDFNAGK